MTPSVTAETPLYNSQIIDLYIRLVRKKYPHVDMSVVLDFAGITPYQAADPGHWLTQEEVNRFHEKLAEISGDLDIALEAGRYSASSDALGFVRHWALTMLGPMKTFRLMEQTVKNFTRSSTYATTPLGHNCVQIIVSINPGVKEEPFQCANRTGFFLGFFDVLGYPPPHIEHSECLFHGGNVCRYIISWEAPLSVRLRRYAWTLAALGVASAAASIATLWMFPAAVVSAIASPVLWALAERVEKDQLKQTVTELEGKSMLVLESFSRKYADAGIASEFGELLTASESAEIIAEMVLQKIRERLAYVKGAMLLTYGSTLVTVASFGFSREQYNILKQPFSRSKEGNPLFNLVEQQMKPVLAAERNVPLPGGSDFAQAAGLADFICAPIICDHKFLGIILLDRGETDQPLLQADLNLITAITNMTGISIRNARLMEEHIRQYRSMMELEEAMREIAAAKEKNERYLAELEQINEEMKNFTYIVSHDLRAPLVNIKGFAAELRSSFAEIEPCIAKAGAVLDQREHQLVEAALADDIPEAVKFIESSVTRMDGLINSLLKLSRLGRRELNPERVDLGKLVQDILQTLAHQLEQRTVQVSVEDLPEVTADRTAMEQVFGNLLDNAVKYLAPDRPGRLRISAERDGEEILFRVADNGRGIAAADLHKVFDIFHRSGKRDVAGEGMGLAYVKALVRRHDGRIWCESEEGAGTTFFFTLPSSHTTA